ncbi:ABC transporter ATP-binding protein [Shimazuella sp. AN120528]|uniref:ABC transporter ATP-binding protein n=1 Tax=Shimazuella soli TaxID=1892854 RepID=UPI001F10CE9E|nr:ABC transporter ATP-binding protein [Shimazuella soli]MCH5584600.1 ABC transporter ATP-binding protein [Shimazuella soli]
MIVEMKNVSWRRDQRLILDQINWEIHKGEHWCLVGLNGSGKTSILDLINGYHWPTSGEITVLDQRFGETDLRELRKKIGWVSTSMQQRLHGYETIENVVLSGKFASVGVYEKPIEDDYEQVNTLLQEWRCGHLQGRIYQTLSQGEKQKVLIGRALMASPELLILDEPCTGLDIFAREQVLHMIDQIAKSPNAPTLIYVTHHIEEILPCFTHTLLLKQGQVAQKGWTKDVLTEQNLSEFFQTSLSVEQKNGRSWLMLT